LKSASDITILGYEEYLFGEGISVIEWPDRLEYLLPKEYLALRLSVKGQNKRSIKIKALGKRYSILAEKINENIRN
jgi:tRNA threonylcarbamoyladenosine biosynthesis protein TsaE